MNSELAPEGIIHEEDSLTRVEENTSLSPEEQERVLGLREPEKENIAKTRERVRSRLTYLIVGSTLILAAAIAIRELFSGRVQDAITGVFTPIIGLAGVVLGFYFGGKDSTT